MFSQSDEQLIKKALKGHKGAWLKLVGRHEKTLYNYLLRMVSNAEDARDLMQEVFLSVFRNLGSFRGDCAFKGWLLKIAHHRVVEFYRRKRHFVDFDEIDERDDEHSDTCPVASAESAQQGQVVISALAKLPVNQRAVVELKFFQHLTFDEIASQLGVSSNTVKSRLYAGLDKMKRVLEVADVR